MSNKRILQNWIMKYLILFILASVVSVVNAGEILIIGDSHSCGPFGAQLVERLTKKGDDVKLFCAVSSAPMNWIQGKNPPGQICQFMTSASRKLSPCGGSGKIPKLDVLLKQSPNAKVIAALGTNSLASPKIDASYRQMAEAIRSSDHSCVWVGPPHLNPPESKGFPPDRVATLERNIGSFYDSLAGAVEGGCILLDSRDITGAGRIGNQTVDGVHRNAAAGESWAEFVATPAKAAGEKVGKPVR